MLPILFSLAHAAPPEASAFVSSDGQYSLILRPDVAWEAAEISISGDGAEDLGSIEAGAEVRIDGNLSGPGTIWVNLNAAIDDDTGINWVFSVEPEVVPVRSPHLARYARRSLRWCLFKRRQG
ncbi:MAG: hypothetical protein P8R54_08890 [Myxococcota bacterium]|nr:hypothetical protein [Myxococcota bacterium]